MARVISFINYKGGVGKTTSAYHIACSLAQHHKQRVLMIDIDPQTNLTFLCAEISQWQRRKRTVGTIKNLYEHYVNRSTLDVQRFIWNDAVTIGRYPISGLDLLPCDIDLLGEDLSSGQIASAFPTIEAAQKNAQQYLRERSFLRQTVDSVHDRYDWIVIDCPPNLYLMSENALHASDYYVVTAIPDHLSTVGLNILTNKIRGMGERIARAQVLAGAGNARSVAELGAIVFVKVRSGGSMIVNTHQDTMLRIESDFPGKVISKYTTELIGYSEAALDRMPVWELNSTNARRAARENQYPEITRQLVVNLRQVP